MQTQSFTARLALVVAMVYPAASCQTMGHKAVQDAHTLYLRGDYTRAAELYAEGIANDADVTAAYFYLANSYDNLYRPALDGDADNDRLLELAIDNYVAAVERAIDPAMRTRAMWYLAVAYGPDKANDPALSEPLLQQLIQSESSDPAPFLALAKVREDEGRTDEAEQLLLRARELGDDDVNVYVQLAGFYSRNGQFESSIEALRQRATIEPDNPEAFYTIGTFYWEKAFRDASLSNSEEEEIILLALSALDRALALNADYVEALIYKNILLRMQANHSEDAERQAELLAGADALRDRAEELALARRER
jgi:hypothetical protein